MFRKAVMLFVAIVVAAAMATPAVFAQENETPQERERRYLDRLHNDLERQYDSQNDRERKQNEREQMLREQEQRQYVTPPAGEFLPAPAQPTVVCERPWVFPVGWVAPYGWTPPIWWGPPPGWVFPSWWVAPVGWYFPLSWGPTPGWVHNHHVWRNHVGHSGGAPTVVRQPASQQHFGRGQATQPQRQFQPHGNASMARPSQPNYRPQTAPTTMPKQHFQRQPQRQFQPSQQYQARPPRQQQVRPAPQPQGAVKGGRHR